MLEHSHREQRPSLRPQRQGSRLLRSQRRNRGALTLGSTAAFFSSGPRGGVRAGIRDGFEPFEKTFTVACGECRQHLLLQFRRDLAGLFEGFSARGLNLHAARAAIRLVGVSNDQPRAFHAGKGGGDRIRVAGHQVGERPLGEPARIAFAQPAEDGELIRSEPERCDALAEGLVEPVPRPAQ